MKTLKFWGTRGSCPVSGPEYQLFGGNTLCLEICYEKTRVIIDAGTGIRPLGEKLEQTDQPPIDLFLSHTHWDHIHGFPFFKLLDKPNQQITIWSPFGMGRSTEQLFDQLLSPEFFPIPREDLRGQITFQTIQEKTPIQKGPLSLSFHKTYHPGIAFCFKIKTPHQTIGYVTDNEIFHDYHGEIDKIPKEMIQIHSSLIHFLSDCDVLVHEAQYLPEEYKHKIGWGHSSLFNVIGLIREAKIKRWLVSHHDPKHTDQDLKQLEKLSHKVLAQHNIDCTAQWIGDGFVLDLK